MSESDRDRLDAAEVRAREWQHSLSVVRQIDPDSRNIIGMLLRMEDKLDALSDRIKALEERLDSGEHGKCGVCDGEGGRNDVELQSWVPCEACNGVGF